LTAGYSLAQANQRPLVLEQADKVGGIARTETYRGYRFDIGGHRFYTQVVEVQQFWQDLLGDEFVRVPRLSRIFYRGKFFHYPIDLFDTLRNLGVRESVLSLLSYLRARALPQPVEDNFEQWVSNRFGRRLYHAFFKTYTEKVWGIPCSAIHAEWAAQRIRGLSFISTVAHALFRHNEIKSLINEFHYPTLGPGMMWERVQQRIVAAGGAVELSSLVTRVHHTNGRIVKLLVEHAGQTSELPVRHLISTMPLNELLERLDPPPPTGVIQAARNLVYRAFVIVGLIVRQRDLFPDNWLYIHSPQVQVGRIQNFKNWSAAMVPDASTTSLGMEYFCDEGDALWTMRDGDLIVLATRELEQLGLAQARDVTDGVVIRQPKAYPVYTNHYRTHLQTIREYLAPFENLQTVGRNGMHRYNNQDHSMLTGMLAAKNVLGDKHDLWQVNTDRSYYEEFMSDTLGEEA